MKVTQKNKKSRTLTFSDDEESKSKLGAADNADNDGKFDELIVFKFGSIKLRCTDMNHTVLFSVFELQF